MIVLYEPSGYPIKAFGSWWKASQYVVNILEPKLKDRPDMLSFYELEQYTNINKLWVLFKYPWLKIE